MVVEGHTGADDVNEGRSAVRDGPFDQRHQLRLVAGKAARHIAGTQLQRQGHKIQRVVAVDHTFLAF